MGSPSDAIEGGRLRRAAKRAVKRLGDGQFAVAGNEERIYFVDLAEDPPCQCLDQMYHGRNCLHELAAKLHSGDTLVFNALVAMYERQLKAGRE